MVSAGSDGKIIVYEGKELTKQREISDEKEGHKGAIYSFCFNDDGSKFVTCGSDKTCKIWGFESGAVEATYTIGTDIDDQQMCVLWVKDWIVSISLSGALNYLDPASPGTIKRTVVGHMSQIKGMSVDTANKKVYSVDAGGKLCVWENNLATWFKGKGHNKGLTGCAVNCDGSVVASVGLDDCLRFNETKSIEFSTAGIGVGGAPSCVCMGSKTADLAVVGIGQGKLTVVQGNSAKSTAVSYKPLCVALNPDDTKLLVGGDDKAIHLYSISGGELKEEHVCKTHQHHVLSVKWSPCGKRYTSSGADKCVLVHDSESHAQLNNSSWEFHRMMVNDHAWSPDGSKVATISNDLNIMIWNDTEKFSTKKTKISAVHSVSANGIDWLDNNTLITWGMDGCFKRFTLE
jgi:WD40 repeat protein